MIVIHRLALHWQILVGMLVGSLVGLLLNLAGSRHTITVEEGLPQPLVRATIDDSRERVVIVLVDDQDGTTRYVIDDRQTDALATLDQLRDADDVAADVYLRYGQSPAKYWGGWFHRVGSLFLRMLKMVAVPLIVTSLLTGILNLGGAAGVGRMFRYTIAYYVTTSFLAIVTGLVVVNLLRPGLHGGETPTRPVDPARASPITEAEPLGEVLFRQLEAILPDNPLGALVTPNFLSLISFTLAFGIFALYAGETTSRRIRETATAGFEVMMSMTTAIIRLAPIGVMLLIAHVTATQGGQIFRSLGWYILSVALALLVHSAFTLPWILRKVAKRNPREFARAMSPALLTAFSTASSNGTLPLTLSNVENRAGISNRTSSFVLPLGATVNMDGTALYEAVAVLFIAQLHLGQNLPLAQQVIVVLTALVASIGTAGIPHAGLVTMVVILQTVGLPLEMQGVILAVDRVVDMARTGVNVWGDACGCAVVERLVGTD